MGDAGEGWVDAEARIQERMEELQQERALSAAVQLRKNSVESRQIKSLELAKRELERQRQAATHPMRRAQLDAAIADVDRRVVELEKIA